MKFDAVVIDASAALAWAFDDDGLQRVLHPLIAQAVLHAPQLWQLEVINGVLKRERRRQITLEQSDIVLMGLAGLGVELDAAGPAPDSIVAVSRRYQATPYDTMYLDLALRLGLPLLTSDGGLVQAAKEAKVPLVWQKPSQH